jgi:MFS family permease
VSGAASVEHEFGLTHRGYAVFAFAFPLVAAAALEAGLALLSDVWGRARLAVFAQGALAASLFCAGRTSTAWGFGVCLAFAGAASGVSCGAAQALLLASDPGDEERTMVRWSLYSAVGDVLAPVVTAAAIWRGHSYRAAMEAVAIVASLQCAVAMYSLLRGGRSAAPLRDSEPPAERPGAALVRALRLPRLWTWLFAAASCTLLDELVIALGALRMERGGNASAAVAAAAAVTFSMGAVLGSAVTDYAVARTSAPRVLLTSAVLCALSLLAFLASGGLMTSCGALLLVGVSCAPHHPLVMARAYGELPGHPGTVQALAQIFVVVDVGAPLVLGVVADRFGLGAAIGCLLVQPVVIATSCVVLRRGASPRPHERAQTP